MLQVEELAAADPNAKQPAKLEWPWSPRPAKRLTTDEKSQIRNLAKPIRSGHLDVDDITRGYGVSANTIQRILSDSTGTRGRAKKQHKPKRKAA